MILKPSFAPGKIPCCILRFDSRLFTLLPKCRVSRKTTIDEDLLIRVPHPQAVSLAETILKAGIHQYPQSEFLLIVQTGLRIHLKNEKPVRTKAHLAMALNVASLLSCFLTKEAAVTAHAQFACHAGSFAALAPTSSLPLAMTSCCQSADLQSFCFVLCCACTLKKQRVESQ